MNCANNANNEKLLGLYWDHENIFSLKINEVFKEAIDIIRTKRNILSVIASAYDPSGLSSADIIK